MDGNVLVALFDVFFFLGPLILVGVGALVYDRLQRHKTRVGDNYRCRRCGFVFQQKMRQSAVLKATGTACILTAADAVLL